MGNVEVIIGVLAVFAAFAVFIWQMFDVFSKRVIKPIDETKEEVKKIDEKFTGEIRQIHTKITEITKEVTPNGGSSMKDVQKKIYESVRVLHDRDTFNFYLDLQPKFECDSNGFCIRVNDSFAEATGITENKALGNGWMMFISEAQQSEFINRWELAMEKNLPFDMKVNDHNGKTFRVRASSNNHKDNRRMILGTLEKLF